MSGSSERAMVPVERRSTCPCSSVPKTAGSVSTPLRAPAYIG